MTRARGHAERPLTDTQLYEKFADCLDQRQVGGCAGRAVRAVPESMQSVSARQITAVR